MVAAAPATASRIFRPDPTQYFPSPIDLPVAEVAEFELTGKPRASCSLPTGRFPSWVERWQLSTLSGTGRSSSAAKLNIAARSLPTSPAISRQSVSMSHRHPLWPEWRVRNGFARGNATSLGSLNPIYVRRGLRQRTAPGWRTSRSIPIGSGDLAGASFAGPTPAPCLLQDHDSVCGLVLNSRSIWR